MILRLHLFYFTFDTQQNLKFEENTSNIHDISENALYFLSCQFRPIFWIQTK